MPRKKSKSDLSAKKARRYTRTQKAEILAYVDEFNAENGRGGLRAASRKFGVSPLSISNWSKNAGAVSGDPSSAKGKGKLVRLARQVLALAEEMEALEGKLERKRARFDELKRQL